MDYTELASELAAAGQSFVVATVVRCEPPASARPGAKAVVRPDGSMAGWVGGSCAQPLVVKEAQRALRDGKPRLLRLCPTVGEGGGLPGLVEQRMTCHSGGTLEIFIEPVLPAPRLCVVGDSPIAAALAALGRVVGYRVEPVALPLDGPEPAAAPLQAALAAGDVRRTAVVIATMGMADEEALEAALRSEAPYVALVASPRRAEKVREYLLAQGLTPERVGKLRAPAGLNLGAETAEEIALSILAEIVQARATAAAAVAGPDSPLAVAAPPEEATDPVCGMSVATAGARHTAEHDGAVYYFCCPGCKAAFAAEPARFLAAAGVGR